MPHSPLLLYYTLLLNKWSDVIIIQRQRVTNRQTDGNAVTLCVILTRGKNRSKQPENPCVYIHCVSKIHLTFDHNVGKCRPIFKLISVPDSQRNCLCNYYRVLHLTLTVHRGPIYYVIAYAATRPGLGRKTKHQPFLTYLLTYLLTAYLPQLENTHKHQTTNIKTK